MKLALIFSAVLPFLAEGGGENVYKIDFGLSPIAAIFLLLLVIILIWLALSTNTEFSDTGEAHVELGHGGHEDEAHGEPAEHAEIPAEVGHAVHEEHGTVHIEEAPVRMEEAVIVEEAPPAPEPALAPAPEPAPVPAPVVPARPDDLKIIEGIGPKIARVMTDAGVATFAQMAAASVEKLQAILDAAELRLADPATWPEQARLAASGDMEALQKYQDSLKAGRVAN